MRPWRVQFPSASATRPVSGGRIRAGARGTSRYVVPGAPMRRLLLLVLLIGAMSLVAAAPVPVVDTLGRALTDGVAAQCRHVVDAAPCEAVDGRDVSESAVARAETGDVAAVLAFQRGLQADVPLRSAVFPATHNSYNSLAYDPTLSRLDANQTVSLRDQLRLGMRRLELDVHWWFAPDGSRVPVTCHATDEPNVLGDPVTAHTGCTTEDTVDVALREIAGWLEAHPDEVIMLRFETHLDGAEGHDALAADTEAILGERLYRPAGPGCTALPLDLTTSDVRAAGAQVIAIGGCGQGSVAWQRAAFDDDAVRRESTYRGAPYAYPDCGGVDEATAASSWIRWFEDATVVSAATAAATGGEAPARVTPEVVRAWTRCGVNQPSVDHLVPDDPRLDALVWSFAPGTLEAPEGSCAVLDAGGLGAVPCQGQSRPFTCRSSEGLAVTSARGPWQAGDDACAAEGLGHLATPRTGGEAAELQARLEPDATAPWVSLRRVDAAWRLGCVTGRAGGPHLLTTRPPVSCPAD